MSGQDRHHGIYGAIQQVVLEETKWLKHYTAKVINNADPLNKGRVQITIDEIGLTILDPGLMIWAHPRDKHGLDIPSVGEVVEVYFMAGNPNRPVYMGIAMESTTLPPSQYLSPLSHVLFQDSIDSGAYITYDGLQKAFDVSDKLKIDTILGQITMLTGVEAFVKGTTFDTFLSVLMIWLGSHVHTTATPGNPTSPPVVPAPSKPVILSTKIMGE